MAKALLRCFHSRKLQRLAFVFIGFIFTTAFITYTRPVYFVVFSKFVNPVTPSATSTGAVKTTPPSSSPPSSAQSAQTPWFMRKGQQRPTAKDPPLPVWPEEDKGDRIVNQLMYIPKGYKANADGGSNPLKKIALVGGWQEDLKNRFQNDRCPVDSCEASFKGSSEPADAVIFRDFIESERPKQPGQIWIMYTLESPFVSLFSDTNHKVDWTASYRTDSDLVAPYEKFVPYSNAKANMTANWAAGKTKKVAWFVSNCGARNGRLEYAQELKKFIDVDIYGQCGSLRCRGGQCLDMLRKNYKFYLSFENGNCKGYMTEKFFRNALMSDVLPIVMGARKEDYLRVAPYHSFIHVDDFASPKELADYLHKLDQNDALYSEYFRWKDTGEFINTYFWCRLCAMLHAPPKPSKYKDLEQWWNNESICFHSRTEN